MNQGKLEVVKQEMARVKVDILGISELKWTRIGELFLIKTGLKNYVKSENNLKKRERRKKRKRQAEMPGSKL